MTKPILILASESQIRREILGNAGIKFKIKPSRVDETNLKKEALDQNKSPEDIAKLLALAKAENIKIGANTLCIGADQLLEMEGVIYDKPRSMQEARIRLQKMRGREHKLVGALVVCEQGQNPWIYQSTTTLFMRDFSDEFLDIYMQTEGEDVLKSVGGYMFERGGAQLFEWVDGDFFSILGLSLLPLLAYLRTRGALMS
ncbi:MAG: Maf-like protein [Robiginitomaculum sp.]|nr:Maf-like protein [Robiginitomaculum sp.]